MLLPSNPFEHSIVMCEMEILQSWNQVYEMLSRTFLLWHLSLQLKKENNRSILVIAKALLLDIFLLCFLNHFYNWFSFLRSILRKLVSQKTWMHRWTDLFSFHLWVTFLQALYHILSSSLKGLKVIEKVWHLWKRND